MKVGLVIPNFFLNRTQEPPISCNAILVFRMLRSHKLIPIMNIAKRLAAITFTLVLLPTSALHAVDAWWITLNAPNFTLSEHVKTRSHAEFRFPEAEFLGYYRFSQKFNTRLGKKWTLGTHPTIEGSRSRSQSDYNETYRIDLELNPNPIQFGEGGPTLALRNRWEVQWKEGRGSEVFNRVRQYTTLTWPVNHDLIKFYRIGNEVFYDADRSVISMNRLYPVMLGLPISDAFSCSVYYMYQRSRVGTSHSWRTTHVIGTSLSF